jgi:hypothetical protein
VIGSDVLEEKLEGFLANSLRKNTFLKNMNTYTTFEVFTAVTMKNAGFWDITPFGFYKYRCFVGT